MDEILESPEGKDLLKKYMNEQDYTMSMAGCTANVVLVTKEKIYVANAGDARCYLFKKDGKFEALSEDHKPDNPQELARVKKAGGVVVDGRIN